MAASPSSPVKPELDLDVEEAIERLQNAVVDTEPVLTDIVSRTNSVQEQVFLECEKFKSTVKKAADRFRERLNSIDSFSKSRSRFTSETDNDDKDIEKHLSDEDLFESFENSVQSFPATISLEQCSTSSHYCPGSGSGSGSARSASVSGVFEGQGQDRSQDISSQSVPIQQDFDVDRDSKGLFSYPSGLRVSQVKLREKKPKRQEDVRNDPPIETPITFQPTNFTWSFPTFFYPDPPVPIEESSHRPDSDSVFETTSLVSTSTNLSSDEHSSCSSVLSSPKFVFTGDTTKKTKILGVDQRRNSKATNSSPKRPNLMQVDPKPMSPICARFLNSPRSSRRTPDQSARSRIASDTTVLEEAKLALEELSYRTDVDLNFFNAVLQKVLNVQKTQISNSSNEMTEIVCHFFKLFVTYPKSVYHIASICSKISEDPSIGDFFLKIVLRQTQLELNYVLKIVCTVPSMDKRLLGLIWFMTELHLNLTPSRGRGQEKRAASFVVLAIAELLKILLGVRKCPHLISNFHCATQVIKIITPSLSGSGSEQEQINLLQEGLNHLRWHCKQLEMSSFLTGDLKKALVHIRLHIHAIHGRLWKKIDAISV